MFRRDVWITWFATLAYMAVIYLASDQPGTPRPQLIPHFDKILHFFAYGVLAVLWVESLWKSGRRGVSAFWIAVGACAFYGATDEFHQSFVPGRDVSIADWIADSLGAACGAWLWLKRRSIDAQNKARYTNPSCFTSFF